ncbi:MAG: response regulator, partial [Planctomycetota bacterium]
MRVLVVDDEPLARRVLTRFLREDPDVTELVESKSGEDARAVLARGAADVVFMDVQMPGIDGFAALSARRSDAP